MDLGRFVGRDPVASPENLQGVGPFAWSVYKASLQPRQTGQKRWSAPGIRAWLTKEWALQMPSFLLSATPVPHSPMLGLGPNPYELLFDRPTSLLDPLGLQPWTNVPPPIPPKDHRFGGDDQARNRWESSWKEKLICVLRCLGMGDRADHMEKRGFDAITPFGSFAGYTWPNTTSVNPEFAGDCKTAVSTYLHESIHSYEDWYGIPGGSGTQEHGERFEKNGKRSLLP